MAESKRLTSIYRKVAGNKGGITFSEFEELLQALGFQFRRQRGSHRIYVHPNLDRAFPVQPEGKDAKRYQVRQLRDMIRKYRLRLDANG